MNRLKKIYLGLWAAWIITFVLTFLHPFRGILFFALIILTSYYLSIFARKLIRKLLWRIRRKLIISYIFIGLVPLLLLAILVLLGSFIFLGQSTSATLHSSLNASVLRVRVEAEKLLNLERSLPPDEVVPKWLESLSMDDQRWLRQAEIRIIGADGEKVLQGSNLKPLPDWLHKKDWSGMVTRGNLLCLTAVTFDTTGTRSLVIQVPMNQDLLEMMKSEVRADIQYFALGDTSASNEFEKVMGSTRRDPIWPVWWDFPVAWFNFPDQYEWDSGDKMSIFDRDDDKGDYNIQIGDSGKRSKTVGVTVKEDDQSASEKRSKGAVGAFLVTSTVSRVTGHIFSQSSTLQRIVYAIMIGVTLTFLFIELISLGSGFLLARSITSSVHELFEGTERIRTGDLNYRIHVKSKDQLGELAVSFNQMTDSIKDLLKERTEKERLAESLRIARQLQEKLLPSGVAPISGVEISTLNLAAEEVCGDYYDVICKDDHQMGIIIADVSGKGPGAALYMAEVKGVMMSVARRSLQPRDVLIEANQILAPTLDSRNFITMTFALVDQSTHVIRVSRAGHNPLLHYSSASNTIEIVQPQGIGLGIGRNGIFERTLTEEQRDLNEGDIIVFYTDGLTEAMNDKNDLYGLDRLSQIILSNKLESTEKMKACILEDLNGFLKQGPPQDDITLVLLKISGPSSHSPNPILS